VVNQIRDHSRRFAGNPSLSAFRGQNPAGHSPLQFDSPRISLMVADTDPMRMVLSATIRAIRGKISPFPPLPPVKKPKRIGSLFYLRSSAPSAVKGPEFRISAH